MDCHIEKKRGVIRSKIVFFRMSNISVPCPHAQLKGRTTIKKLWTFFGPWGRDRSQSPPCWIFSGQANTSIHGLEEDDTATIDLGLVPMTHTFY